MSDLFQAFARLTNQDLPVATQQMTEIVQRIFFSELIDEPSTKDNVELSDSYYRLVAFREAVEEMTSEPLGRACKSVIQNTIDDDIPDLPTLARVALSIGSRVIVNSPWFLFGDKMAQDLSIEAPLDVPAELINRHF